MWLVKSEVNMVLYSYFVRYNYSCPQGASPVMNNKSCTFGMCRDIDKNMKKVFIFNASRSPLDYLEEVRSITDDSTCLEISPRCHLLNVQILILVTCPESFQKQAAWFWQILFNNGFCQLSYDLLHHCCYYTMKTERRWMTKFASHCCCTCLSPSSSVWLTQYITMPC